MNSPQVGMHPGAAAPEGKANSPQVGMHPGASAPEGSASISRCIRKNIRAEFHDYSGGDYFVTICTRNKAHYFGEIVNGEMHYTAIGKFAYEALNTLITHYSYVEVPLFVIMPNHVHAIICIREAEDSRGAIPQIRTLLGVVVGGYKQSVTRFARRNNIEFGWQGRYHDHIIRGANDGNRIAEYIENNPQRWNTDCYRE